MDKKPFFARFGAFYRLFIKPYRARTVTAILLAVVVGSLDSAIAFLLRPYTNAIMQGQEVHSVSFVWFSVDTAIFPILIVAFALVQSAFSYAALYMNTWAGKRMGNDVKIALFDKLMRCDASAFDKSTSGGMNIKYNLDADLASDGLIANVTLFVKRGVSSLCLIIVMFYISWWLAVVAVGALLITVVPLSRVRRRVKLLVNEALSAGAVIGTNYFEAFSGNRVVTSYDLYETQREKLMATLRNTFRINIKMAQRTGFLSLVMHFSTSVGIAVTIGLQGYLIMTGRITPGDFVGFLAALIMLYTPLKNLGNNFNNVQASFMAMERVLDTLAAEPAIVNRPNARKLDRLVCSIKYDNVDFAYDPGVPVLRNINLEVGAGQSVAFVGNSGCGKTTLVNLLPRFYDVVLGSVSINGVDVRDAELSSLRRLIAIVFQDNFLFAGTIRENILLGKIDATGEELAAAVDAACLGEFVASLEQGLDTQIGERGILLSGGQKQRIAIARAFIKDAPIVILDEATSALDNKSEAVVQQAIENLMRNKTVLIIAHRLSTVINADRIVVIKEGEIVESGRHAELVTRQNGIYASLYASQLH